MATNLESRVSDISSGLGLMHDVHTNSSTVGSFLEKYALSSPAVKTFFSKIKGSKRDPKFYSAFMNKIKEYSGRVSESYPLKRVLSQYSLANLKTKAGSAKDMIYSIPGRLYPYTNAIGGYWKTLSRYASPFTGPANMAKDAAWYAAKQAGKAAWGAIKKPLMYAFGGYVAYKAIRYFLNKRKENKQIEELREANQRAIPTREEYSPRDYVTRRELEDVLSDIRQQNSMLSQRIRPA